MVTLKYILWWTRDGKARESGVGRVLFATSKELRVRTREILEKVKKGERFAITYRGRPVALLVPLKGGELEPSIRPYEEAWADIMEALEASDPYYPDWGEAIRESRGRK